MSKIKGLVLLIFVLLNCDDFSYSKVVVAKDSYHVKTWCESKTVYILGFNDGSVSYVNLAEYTILSIGDTAIYSNAIKYTKKGIK
jgi:hypothetical protein